MNNMSQINLSSNLTEEGIKQEGNARARGPNNMSMQDDVNYQKTAMEAMMSQKKKNVLEKLKINSCKKIETTPNVASTNTNLIKIEESDMGSKDGAFSRDLFVPQNDYQMNDTSIHLVGSQKNVDEESQERYTMQNNRQNSIDSISRTSQYNNEVDPNSQNYLEPQQIDYRSHDEQAAYLYDRAVEEHRRQTLEICMVLFNNRIPYPGFGYPLKSESYIYGRPIQEDSSTAETISQNHKTY
ncbi:unnamed protein product [Moneuplotes crassus]|uniref:Uncharacterized protein n=1 Tax=Euplotes crassus TaxID=5936 RepID=A0AAD1XS50_EUPCR|nr:unnamed protein product [Moneuplotes crassus]